MTPERIHRIRETLSTLNADALILTSPANRQWATGFTSYAGTAFSTDIALVTQESVELLVSRNNVDWARGESTTADNVWASSGAFPAAIADWIGQKAIASVAIEGDAFPHPYATALIDLLPGVAISFPTMLRESWRGGKDDQEIAWLECAARITDQVFEEVASALAPGVTEAHVARTISARLIELGDGLGFDVIVASGPNAARPHHRPGDRVIEEQEPIVIDLGGKINGYCGDLTRTLFLGSPSRQFTDVYRAVFAAQEATKAAMSAGRPVRDVAGAADRSLQESGFGEYILHSVGHGVGLEIHESPAIRNDLDTYLPKNAVVTVEPGVYIPGWGGVRIEDVVVVGDSGCRTITTASKLSFD